MSTPINFLRLYRKRTPLTQGDVAFLLGLSDESNISRYEKGQREPGLDFLISYHLLFNTSIESFFEYKSRERCDELMEKIKNLIVALNNETTSSKNTERIRFLESVIIRLTKENQ